MSNNDIAPGNTKSKLRIGLAKGRNSTSILHVPFLLLTPLKMANWSQNVMKLESVLVFRLGLGLRFGKEYFSKIWVRVGVIVRGEKCVRGARFVFFFLLGSSTDRNSQVPRGLVGKFNDFRWRVGGSNLSHVDLFISTFFFFFFVRSGWLRKISRSHRQKRASPDMREHTLMTF